MVSLEFRNMEFRLVILEMTTLKSTIFQYNLHLSNLTTVDMRGQKKSLLGNELPRIHKYFQERGFEVQVIVHEKLVVFVS